MTCVGGTEFDDSSDPSKYWAPTNSAHLSSALSYIPEGAWNDPSETSIEATGGGSSLWIPQPSWQVGTGVPATGKRNTPDVAFTASLHDAYYMCLAYPDGSGDCSQHKFRAFGGTSASTPSMAGIMALINQGLAQRQGNVNPTLYALAASTLNGVFNDVTTSSSGIANCDINTPSLCNKSITLLTSPASVLQGFSVTRGYDLATGWGSMNFTNLLSALMTHMTPVASTTSLSLSSDTISTDESTTITVNVFGNVGSPTGTIQLTSNGKALGLPLAVDFGTVIAPKLFFSDVGTYSITARYSGDSLYAPSISAAVILTSVLPSFELSSSPASVTISSLGASGASTVTASTSNGFVGTLSLTCAVPAMDDVQIDNLPTCSIGDNGHVTLTASNPTSTVALTIGTVAPHSASVSTHPATPTRDSRSALAASALFIIVSSLYKVWFP